MGPRDGAKARHARWTHSGPMTAADIRRQAANAHGGYTGEGRRAVSIRGGSKRGRESFSAADAMAWAAEQFAEAERG